MFIGHFGLGLASKRIAPSVSLGGGYAAQLRALPVLASHWVLDVVVHRPDMPFAPGLSARLGLGLWNSVPGTLAVEFLLYGVGASFYLRSTVARDRVGSIGLWALRLVLAVIELANVFGPPPPNVSAVTWSAEAMWLLVAWGYWVDRHRDPLGRTLVA